MEHDELLTERQAAQLLTWTVKTLQARRWLKQPPVYLKLGRSIRYRRSDLEAFLEDCAVEPREAARVK